MLISPPFLPDRANNLIDIDWVNLAMVGGIPGSGGYPVSYNLGWHGGIHLEAPPNGQDRQIVRAIADGTVVYVRQPTQRTSEATHPLNYYQGWTSDGCVVIRHETEIGADAQNQSTNVTFYSVTMHLENIRATVQAGRRIYRKDELGQAGYIYGDPNMIHFEIICDDANLQRLVGRANGDLNTAADGRTDAVFGEMFFHLPAGALIYNQAPLDNNPVAQQQPPAPQQGGPLPPAAALAPVHTTATPLIVGLRYAGGDDTAGNRGNLYVTTYRQDGTALGDALTENDAEYNLYQRATAISNAYPATGRPAPSAVYELLRFGRAIGPDALNPNNVPHWRRIRYDGGEGWVNLNATGVTKFSDADFPHWKGWKLIDDSADRDSRCDSATIKGWLDQDGDGKVDPNEAVSLLPVETIQGKMKRTICKIPTEWEKATVEARWGWLKTQSDENPAPLSDEDFNRLKAHIEKLAFWEQANVGIPANHWHFHPREFITLFRKCGWLSLEEMAMTFPKHLFYTNSGNPRTAITTNNSTYTMTRMRARNAIINHYLTINLCLRKYVGSHTQRISIFLSQVMLETAQWRNPGGTKRLMHEWSYGAFSSANPATQHYSAFYGRGIMQLTWAGNYINYGSYRQLANHNGTYTERLVNQPARINATSLHYSFNPSDNGTLFQWAPRYDPDIIGEQPYEACDSGGFYWVSKQFSEGLNINRVADRPYNEINIGLVNRLVNGGSNGYYERQAYTAYMLRILTENTDTSTEITLNPPAPKVSVRANLIKAE